MSDPHPKSIRGRLTAAKDRWVGVCRHNTDDVFLVVDAIDEITRLTDLLAATRKHLKAANLALENKAIRLENLGRRLHQRPGDLHPKSCRGGLTAETLRTIGPDAIHAAAARLDGSPGVGTPPEVEKAALGAPLSPEEARRWSTFNKDLDSCDNLHQTTP